MYALKLELKINNRERAFLAGCAGFSRFVYNFGLSMLTQSWEWADVKAGDSKRLSAIEWKNRHLAHGDRRKGIATSNNAKKFYRRIAKRHSHLANIRKDFLQKVTTNISRKYYRIRIEDLNISGMIANHKLAEAVSSCGFYEFRRMLAYKEVFYGTCVELVDRWYPSSKMCSECGNIQPMPLSERVYRCNQCGCEKDRDFNASINLEQAPSDRVRRATAELKPVDKKEPTPLAEAGNKQRNVEF